MSEPWINRDPGDESGDTDGCSGDTTKESPPLPETEAILAESDWAICPNGHLAWLRPKDGALWCEGCGGKLYHESWSGERFPRVTI